jgi:hypothetical protein
MVSIVEFVILSKAKDLFRFFGLCPQNDNVFMQALQLYRNRWMLAIPN